MDADIAYADCALDAWASWVKGGMAAWPAATLLGRIIEQGANGAAQSGRTIDTMPDAILATDRAVAHLDPLLKSTLKVYYLVYLDSDMKAKQLGVSRATFWRRVSRGQKAVYHFLAHGETREYIPSLA